MKILYVERKASEYVSLEIVFRRIASALSGKFEVSFQKVPFGFRLHHTIGNLLFFRRQPADIFHITGHIHYMALLFPPNRTVLTVHDLRFLKAKGRLRKWVLKKLYLDLPVRRLKYITAISKNTKDEIVANTNCDAGKIRVLDAPVFGHKGPISAKVFSRDEPLILQVGTMPNKNLETLVRSVSDIKCRLRIIGDLNEAQQTVLAETGVRFENVANLSGEQMRTEYSNADIVAFCSTYEGFGLPIIEAQMAGKPVITSNISPMPETSGGAACLVDPEKVESIRAGINKVIADDDYRTKLIAAGLENVERFKPERVALQYEELYTEIAATLNG